MFIIFSFFRARKNNKTIDIKIENIYTCMNMNPVVSNTIGNKRMEDLCTNTNIFVQQSYCCLHLQ